MLCACILRICGPARHVFSALRVTCVARHVCSCYSVYHVTSYAFVHSFLFLSLFLPSFLFSLELYVIRPHKQCRPLVNSCVVTLF